MKVCILQEDGNHRTFRFILDSGASITLVTAELVEHLQPNVKIRPLPKAPQASGAAGGNVELEPYEVDFRLQCTDETASYELEFEGCLVTPRGPQACILMGRKDLARNDWGVETDEFGEIEMTLKGHKVQTMVQAETQEMGVLYELAELSSQVIDMPNKTEERIQQMPDAQYAWARKIELKKHELKNTFTINDIKIDPL